MALPNQKEMQGDKELFLDILTKEEKEALLTQKMEAIRQKNRVLQRRHAEIEADKKAAEKFGGAIVLKPTAQEDWPSDKQAEKIMKRASWHPDSSSHMEMKGVSPEDPSRETKFSGGRGKRLAQMSQEKLRAREYENEQKSQGARDQKRPGQRDGKPRPVSVDGPPPDPSYSFLSDRMRDNSSNQSSDKQQKEENSRRHPRNFGGQSLDGVKAKMQYEKGRARETSGARTLQEMEVNMTGRERREYQDWKCEREQIDTDRMTRQRNAEGDWRREWDLNKVDQPDVPLPPASRHVEPNKRPVGRIGSGRFSLAGDERPKGEAPRDKNSNDGNRWVFGQKPSNIPRLRSDDINDERQQSRGKEGATRGVDVGGRGSRGGSNRIAPRSTARVRVVSHSSTGSDEAPRQVEEQKESFVIHVENDLATVNQGSASQRRGGRGGGRGSDRGRGRSEQGKNWRDRSPTGEHDGADSSRWRRGGGTRGRGRGGERGNDRFRNRGGDPIKQRPMSDSFDIQGGKIASLSPDAPEFHPSGNLHLGGATLDSRLQPQKVDLGVPGKNPQVPPFTPGVKWSPKLESTQKATPHSNGQADTGKNKNGHGRQKPIIKKADLSKKKASESVAGEGDDDEWEDEEEVEYIGDAEAEDRRAEQAETPSNSSQTKGERREDVRDDDDSMHDSSSESFERFIQEHTLKIDIEAAAAAMGSLHQVTPTSAPATLSQDSGFKTPLDHEQVPDWGREMEGNTPLTPGTSYGASPLSTSDSTPPADQPGTEGNAGKSTDVAQNKESPSESNGKDSSCENTAETSKVSYEDSLSANASGAQQTADPHTHTNLTDTAEQDDPCTDLPDAPSTDASSANVTDAPSANVTDAPSANVTDAPSTDVTDAPSANITDAPSTDITDASSANVTDASSANVKDAPSTDVTDAPSTDVKDTPSTDVKDTPSTEFTDALSTDVTDNTNVTEAPSTEVTDAPSTDVTDAPSTDVTEAPSTDVTDAPSTDITEAPSTDVTEAPSADFTEAPSTDVTEAPSTDVTEAPSTDFTEAPSTDVAEAPSTDVTDTPSTDVTEAPSADVTEAPSTHVTDAPSADVTEAPCDKETDTDTLTTNADDAVPANDSVVRTPSTDTASPPSPAHATS